MASARMSDHASVNRLKYRVIEPRVYEGPQGDDLQDFIELYEPELKLCHLGIVPPSSGVCRRFTSKLTRTWGKNLHKI